MTPQLLDRLKDLPSASLEELREGIVWAQEEGASHLEAGNDEEATRFATTQAKIQAEMDKRLGSPDIME